MNTIHKRLLAALVAALFIGGNANHAIAQAQPAPAEQQVPEVQVPEVKVQDARVLEGYRVRDAAPGALGERPILDTPFSINVVPRELIENRQASTYGEALRTDPAITIKSSGYSNEATFVNSRGFSLVSPTSVKIDGLEHAMIASDMPLENFERIEMLKGLAGFMYGFTAPGGILNFVTKRPTEEPYAAVTVGWASRALGRAHGDVGGRFGEDKRFGYRMNLAGERGETFVEGMRLERLSLGLALDWRIAPDMLLDVDFGYQQRHQRGHLVSTSLTPAVTALPDPPPGSRRLASSFAKYDTEQLYGSAILRWRLSPTWSAIVSYRASEMDRIFQDTFLTLLNNAGDYRETQARLRSGFRAQQGQAMLTGRFTTGPIEHELVTGAAIQSRPRFRGLVISGVAGLGNLSNPGNFPEPAPPLNRSQFKSQDVRERALFASDTVSWGAWSAIAGARLIGFEQQDLLASGAIRRDDSRSVVTPTYALLYKPQKNWTVYGSFVKALEQGGTAPIGTLNATQTFGPLESRQAEVGVKAELDGVSFAAAAFDIRKGLEFTNRSNVFVQDGERRHRGVEFTASGKVTREITFVGGAMVLDAKNRKAQPAIEGKRATEAPTGQLSAYLEYAVPGMPGLTLSGGAYYVGKRPVDAANVLIADAYTTFDFGARYETKLVGHRTVVRFNVDNAFDERYWVTGFGAITPGDPLVLKLSVQVNL